MMAPLRPPHLLLVTAWLATGAALAAEPCVPAAGSERVIAVHFTVPEGAAVAGLTLLLDYPEAKVTLPGSGPALGPGAVTDVPQGTVSGSNDLGNALRQTIGKAGEIRPGLLFKVHFQDCQGVAQARPGDFSCAVEHASDPVANAVGGVTCSVEGG
jgi:hypothetical protein